ncbi:MAG: T9SS type B sorting domain-containing protein [Bacteroidales bacterium]|jgi:gliding motility-associated-like protein|nr:gliding motility-associated C-terminal domain-containing protein [Bacteroidales bacterium]MCK9498513.1 gliding motility-associated C-terminal domain-containing protein [Bacteroidales bacterium]MDY0315479.1 gliding motility-associated C-terminal domain-containing protein [Bacteroidales bacterium]NLB86697.1 T9SS type B sorting domain-containing protein [Bacteroidales bacterium]
MEKFDEILKNKLRNFQETPSEEVFLKIRAKYPKPKGFFSTYKYHMIAGLTILVLSLTTIYFINNKTKTTETTNQITNNTKENNQKVQNHKNDNSDNYISSNSQNNSRPIINQNNLDKNINIKNKEIQNEIIFKTNDTTICGNSIDIIFDANTNFLQLPKDITVIKSKLGINISSNNFGKYTIYYNELNSDNKIKDSISINFIDNNFAKVNFSKENICPNEDLIININNPNLEPIWDKTNLKISKKSNSTYIISDLKQGENIISFNLEKNTCSQQILQKINVSELPKYRIQTIPEICSKSNASLTILTDANNINSFTLNNENTNTTGRFTNLNSGIYFIRIDFANSCHIADTLLISDSLNISPYFISDKDLINKNSYQFINQTKVDDIGFEQNQNISFIWKIDDKIISELDNFNYVFSKSGTHKIELLANLSETCKKSYSETIEISEINLRIPNIFTPNGDGINDEFVIHYDGELVRFKIDISNKLGEIIFESYDINKSWDGRINGNNYASDGVYYYNIIGEDSLGNKIEKRGVVQLARH